MAKSPFEKKTSATKYHVVDEQNYINRIQNSF